jgi:hypothetical protein
LLSSSLMPEVKDLQRSKKEIHEYRITSDSTRIHVKQTARPTPGHRIKSPTAALRRRCGPNPPRLNALASYPPQAKSPPRHHTLPSPAPRACILTKHLLPLEPPHHPAPTTHTQRDNNRHFIREFSLAQLEFSGPGTQATSLGRAS